MIGWLVMGWLVQVPVLAGSLEDSERDVFLLRRPADPTGRTVQRHTDRLSCDQKSDDGKVQSAVHFVAGERSCLLSRCKEIRRS